MKRLRAKTLPIERLSPDMRDRMFTIFEKYYSEISREQFEKDLAVKESVILLQDTLRNQIQGFSTLTSFWLTQESGKRVRVMYSGDTVIEKDYWGQSALGNEFLRVLLLRKLAHPFQPLYWFLISKGYKTYLMMANNFKTHYPRYELKTPAQEQAVLDAAAKKLFGAHYFADLGIIQFPRSLGQLKEGVAEISERDLATQPRIRFFAEKNPNWYQGTELACIAEMTFTLPLEYAFKSLRKTTLAPLMKGFSAILKASWSAPGTGGNK